MWGLDEKELETLKERAKFFELDKSDSFKEFENKYLKAAKIVENTGESGIIEVGSDRKISTTKHSAERAYERFVTDEEIRDAVSKPIHKYPAVVDENGRKSVKYIGKDATVIINPDTDVIITTWRTGTKIRKKHEKGDDTGVQ